MAIEKSKYIYIIFKTNTLKNVEIMENQLKVRRVKIEKVFNNWEEFENSEIIQEDKRNWQISGSLKVIQRGFKRAFLLDGSLYYETVLAEGFSILHKWSVYSSLNNGGFDVYVWANNDTEVSFFETNYANTRENRKIFGKRQIGVCSVYNSRNISVGETLSM